MPNVNITFRFASADPIPNAVYPTVHFQINYLISQVPQDFRGTLEGIKMQLYLTNGGKETYISDISSDQELYFLYGGGPEGGFVSLLKLDYFALSKIEKLRENDDLKFRMRINFIPVSLAEPERRVPSVYHVDFVVSKADWTQRFLTAFNFKNVFLYELPKIEGDEVKDISKYLNLAWNCMSSGDYDGVFLNCGKATEATKEFLKTKDMLSGNKINFVRVLGTDSENLIDAMEKFWVGSYNFMQPGGRHHGPERDREDAEFTLSFTHGLINLIIKSVGI